MVVGVTLAAATAAFSYILNVLFAIFLVILLQLYCVDIQYMACTSFIISV